jgi:hypothetical protein
MYVACEGQTRFKQRIYAWCKEHGVDSDGEELKKHFQCVFNATLIDDLEIASDGTTGGYLSEFMSFMKPGLPKGMFVFDTLNRNMSGDENSTKEMTKFIRGCDYLRNKFETTVMLVHHTGVADPSRGRGASCLPGALDVILNVQRDDASRDIALTVKKNKDGPEGAHWHFERMEVMLNEELMQSSVVLRQKTGDPSLTEEMTIEAQILQDVVTADANKPLTFNMLVTLYKGRVGYSRTTIQRALANLRADGLLEAGSPLTFTDKGLAQASEKFNGL